MKLANILTLINQVEKSKFINSIDKLCGDAVAEDKALAKRVAAIDGQIKNASSNEAQYAFTLF